MPTGALAADASLKVAHATPSAVALVCRRIHRGINGFLIVAVPLQFYFAGLAVFGASSFGMHSQLGRLMIPLALVSFLVALAGRRAGTSPGRAGFLFVLALLQPILAFAPRASAPEISALHPVVALGFGIVAWQIERKLKG
jgi:hypothetical protein